MQFLTLDSWITSDHHWEHPRIREYQHRPVRHFEIMRERWFERVGEDDVVLHLGDLVCFGDPERYPFWLEGLPGRKYLIRGNHDKCSREWYAEAGFTVIGRGDKVHRWHAPDGRIVAFTHAPDTESWGWDVNVHGHIHANPYWSGTPHEDYRNVSVEVTGYAPVRLSAVLADDWPATRAAAGSHSAYV